MYSDSRLDEEIQLIRFRVRMIKLTAIMFLLISASYDIHPWHSLWFNNPPTWFNILTTVVAAGYCTFVFVLFRRREGSATLPKRSWRSNRDQ